MTRWHQSWQLVTSWSELITVPQTLTQKQINFPDFVLYSPLPKWLPVPLRPRQWKLFKLSKKVNYSLSPMTSPLCPVPMSSYNNGGGWPVMPAMTAPRYGNTLLISHEQLLSPIMCTLYFVYFLSLICFAVGADGDILMIIHRIAFGKKCCQFWSIMDHFWAI